VVKYNVRRPSGELRVSKSMECDTFFPFSALTLFVGRQEGTHTLTSPVKLGHQAPHTNTTRYIGY